MFFLKELPGRQMVEGYAARFDSVDPDTVLRALELMRSASLLIRELEAYFAGHDLSQLRFLTLILIDREPERSSLTASEIADRLDVSRPVVTRTLKSLEQSDLIAIASDEHDARSKRVSLTQAGSTKLEAVLPGYFAILHAERPGSEAA
ncbi:MAG: MarR family transcriptional regulator [Erythrobacter sp.]|uniref:MarR family winged helix-turn-helix transcriptional regulator n=1 Tax=Erythrobacter sp. TaxID=1042 RepID=UPI001B0D5844|nr:MarR family transcriptional regulator [Erythrobacter sp.]MBO6767308.1 MarR family transcriptional regulator [Erythrobacter sp.]